MGIKTLTGLKNRASIPSFFTIRDKVGQEKTAFFKAWHIA
jgi:hypothetical protein